MKSFCRMPWKSVKVDVEGSIKPCCSYIGGLGQYESAQDIPNYIHSSGLQNLKERMRRGEVIPECRVCDEEEALGIHSIRQDSVQRYPDFSEHVEEMEISITNTCNLVCVMCSPRFSSKWHAVEKDLIEKLKWPKPTWTRGRRLMLNADSFDALEPFMRDLNLVRIIGGEPFLSPALMRLFEIWRTLPTGKTLSITTNVSLITDEHIEAMRGLSGVELSCSIDAIGDLFTWIRGVEWSEIESRLLKLQAAGIDFKVGPTIQLINAFNVLDLYRWCKSHRMRVRLNHFLQNPEHLAVRVLGTEDLIRLRKEVTALPEADAKFFIKYLETNTSAQSTLGDKAGQWVREFDRIRNVKLSSLDSRYASLSV